VAGGNREHNAGHVVADDNGKVTSAAFARVISYAQWPNVLAVLGLGYIPPTPNYFPGPGDVLRLTGGYPVRATQ
jgi:hypothetical protein